MISIGEVAVRYWPERMAAWREPGALRRRAIGLAVALALELLLVWVLLTLNSVSETRKPVTVVDISAENVAEAPAPQPEPEKAASPPPGARTLAPPPPNTTVPQPTPLPAPEPVPLIPLPRPFTLPAPPAARAAPPVASNEPAYGPPDSGGRASSYDDSPRVGTAPNGEPMYAASWYTRPTDSQLRGYLSTADGPGWALITCKTVPDYRVEDCVGLDEYPDGSQMLRAVLAAAWQFRVRPPRRGGQEMVGAWVRIRIDYEIKVETRRP